MCVDSIGKQNVNFENSLLNGRPLQRAWTEIKCDLLWEAESWGPGAFAQQDLLAAPPGF